MIAAFIVALAQVVGPPPAVVGRNVTFEWAPPVENTDGTPLTDLGGYVLAIADPAVDLNGSGAPIETFIVADPAATEGMLATTVADGTYAFWVRAFDAAGNMSAWAGPVVTAVDSRGPKPPSNLRLKIVIEVGGP